LSEIEKQLLSLIELMSEIDHFEDDRLLYEQMNGFFHERLGHDELVVLSGAKLIPERFTQDKRYFRILYNKGYHQSHHPADDIEKFLKDFQDSKNPWNEYKIENDSYLFIHIGETSKQVMTAVLRLKGEAPREIMGHFGKLIATHHRNSEHLKQYKKMEELVHTDDVTGLFNQRKLNLDLESALIKHRQIKEKFSILFIDIDHFKSVNDNHGHLVGTKILFDLASLLNCAVRESDFIYRYGGDEFVVLIPSTGPEMAKTIGERVLSIVKSHTFEVSRPGKTSPTQYHLTVSIGVASFPENAKTKEDILELADRMMYQAKKTGRGKVCFTHDIFDSTVLESPENKKVNI
jgi:diguanylate cyclase (GGDEF)-like protein